MFLAIMFSGLDLAVDFSIQFLTQGYLDDICHGPEWKELVLDFNRRLLDMMQPTMFSNKQMDDH